MTKREAENYMHLLTSVARYGVTMDELDTLRRCECTLRRWFENECGNGNDTASWATERDGTTGKPYMVTHYHHGKVTRYPVADRETGARARAQKIAESHGLGLYVQTDCRGASLYLIPSGTVPEGGSIESYYSRGICICS